MHFVDNDQNVITRWDAREKLWLRRRRHCRKDNSRARSHCGSKALQSSRSLPRSIPASCYEQGCIGDLSLNLRLPLLKEQLAWYQNDGQVAGRYVFPDRKNCSEGFPAAGCVL